MKKEKTGMLGNFVYQNATKLYFGDESLKYLKEELKKYGKTVQLIYGGGSIKKNGIYDAVVKILTENGKTVVEDGGVMANPTVEKLYDGINKARENNVDFLLAVGGGSCCDYAKAVAVSVYCKEDPWQKYFVKFDEPDCKILPVGCFSSINMIFFARGNPRLSVTNCVRIWKGCRNEHVTATCRSFDGTNVCTLPI